MAGHDFVFFHPCSFTPLCLLFRRQRAPRGSNLTQHVVVIRWYDQGDFDLTNGSSVARATATTGFLFLVFFRFEQVVVQCNEFLNVILLVQIVGRWRTFATADTGRFHQRGGYVNRRRSGGGGRGGGRGRGRRGGRGRGGRSLAVATGSTAFFGVCRCARCLVRCRARCRALRATSTLFGRGGSGGGRGGGRHCLHGRIQMAKEAFESCKNLSIDMVFVSSDHPLHPLFHTIFDIFDNGLSTSQTEHHGKLLSLRCVLLYLGLSKRQVVWVVISMYFEQSVGQGFGAIKSTSSCRIHHSNVLGRLAWGRSAFDK